MNNSAIGNPSATGGYEYEKQSGFSTPQESVEHFHDQNKPLAPGESIPEQVTPVDLTPKNELSDISSRQHTFVQKKLGELDNPKNEEQDPLTSLRQTWGQEQAQQQKQFADNVDKEVKDARHREELASNAKANEGIYTTRPISEAGQNFFAKQGEIAQQAKADARHQEALDSNEKANEGFLARKPLSPEGQNYFENQAKIAAEARAKAAGQETPEPIHAAQVLQELKADAQKMQEEIAQRKENKGDLPDSLANRQKPEEETKDENTLFREEVASLRKDIEEMKAKLDSLVNKTPVEVVTPVQQTVTAPEQTQQEPEAVSAAPQEELTPEQKYTQLLSERETLLNGRSASELTDQEKIKYADLTISLGALRTSIGKTSENTERRQKRKERIITLVAGVAGVGVGFGMAATAPVSVAAVVAVTLGGRFTAPLIKKWGIKLEGKASMMKFEDRRGKTLEQLAEIDKKINRNAWWGKRLGEVAAIVSGGTAGFGIGVLAHNLFTAFTASHVGQPSMPASGTESTTPTPQADISGNAGVGSNTPTFTGTESAPEVIQTDPGLIQNGRVNLPGSAWDGNLANGPVGELPGGALNHSNYVGGVHEMAAYQLNQDLASAGVTPSELSTLQTAEIHRGLLNGYLDAINSGTVDPNLTDILGNMNSEAAKSLLQIISGR